MPDLRRTQLALYAALAGAILVVGIGALRTGDEGAGNGPRDGGAAAGAGFGGGGAGGGGSAPSGPGLEVEDDGGSQVVIHVAGSVRDPGLYRLPLGYRVGGAVRRAGGGRAAAALDGINLAARLTDGQQVVVPARQPAGGQGPPGGGAAGSASQDGGPVSLGTATTEELESIDGIGPVTAGKILEFRDSDGVGSVDELEEVDGIGPATIEGLRDSLVP